MQKIKIATARDRDPMWLPLANPINTFVATPVLENTFRTPATTPGMPDHELRGEGPEVTDLGMRTLLIR